MRRGLVLVMGVALVLGAVGIRPAAAALPERTSSRAGATAAPVVAAEVGVDAPNPDVTTHAGGSVEMVVTTGPAAGPVVVDLTWTRVGGGILASDVTAEAQADPARASFTDVVVSGAGAQRQGTAFAPTGVPGDGAAHRVRSTFARAGSYTVTAAVRPAAGGAPIATTTQQVLVASAFVPVGVTPLNTEIVDTTPDGNTLVSTAGNQIGFVDITDPSRPGSATYVPTLPGVTSVAVTPDGRWVLVASSNTEMAVIDVEARTEVRRIPMPRGGDSVAIDDDGRYAAVAIENETAGADGSVVLVDLVGEPADWTTRQVTFPVSHPALDRTFSAELQPEYVDFNDDGELAVSIQENNAVAVIDAPTGEIVELWSAGSVTRDTFDIGRNYRYEFDQTMTLARQPDTVQWTPDGHLLTADEGENQGSRAWSLFTRDGEVLYEAGADGIEELHARNGGHGDGNNQFEGADVATFSTGETFAIVGAERAASASVARIEGEHVYPSQVLLTNYRITDPRPEGVHAVPERDLVLISNEDDNTVVIYRRVSSVAAKLAVPTITSHTEMWADLRGASPIDADELWAVNARQGLPYSLHRLTVNATEVLVDDRIEITRDGVGVDGELLRATANDPIGGGAWVASITGARDLLGNPGADVVARVGPDGSVTEELDLAGPGDEIIALATTADGSVLYALGQSAVEAPGSERLQATLYEHTVATGVTRRFVVPAETAAGFRDLDLTPGGDLLVSSTQRSTGSNPDAELFEIQVAGAADGDRLPVSFVRDLAATDRFDMPAASIASLGPNELAVMATGTEMGRSRFQRIAAPLGEGSTSTTTLVSPTAAAPATVAAGAGLTVQFRTNAGLGYVVEARRAGAASDPWVVLPGASGVVRTPAASQVSITVPTRAPALDGTYDIRLRSWNRSGGTQTRSANGALVVTSSAGSVAIASPTEADPAASPGGGQPLEVVFATDRAGTYQVLAKPAGAADDAYVALDVLAGPTVGATTGRVDVAGTITASVAAPAADGDHDVQVRFRAGGAAALEAVDTEPSSVTVTTVPAAAFTLDSPTAAAPVTVPAGTATTATFTTDRPGTLRVAARAAGTAGSWTTLAEQPVEVGSGSLDLTPIAVDGPYDLRATLTTASGFTTTDDEPGALVIATPDPVITTTATTAAPLTSEAAQQFPIPITVNAPGTVYVEVRPVGATAWETSHQGAVTASTTSVAGYAPGPDGLFDLRLRFVNAGGEEATVEVAGGLDTVTPPVVLDARSPRPGAPIRAVPGVFFDMLFGYDRPSIGVSADIRPAGAGDDAWMRLTNVGTIANGSVMRPNTSVPEGTPVGVYDLRFTVRNVGEVDTPLVVPGGLEVVPGPGSSDMVIEEATTHGPNGDADRYVELRNTGAAPVVLDGWKLEACYFFEIVDVATVPAGVTLAPGERYLLASAQSDVDADQVFTDDEFSVEGYLLVRPDGTMADGVSRALCGEGRPVTYTADPTLSHQRRAGAGDTDDNAADLTLTDRTPQGRGSIGAPTVRLTGPSASAPATRLPGGDLDVAFTTNIAGSYAVEVRTPEGEWSSVASGTAAVGTTTVEITLPDEVGPHDLRARVTAAGGTGEDVEAGALVVRPAPTVALTAPTAATPATVLPGAAVTVAFTADQAAPYEITATASGGAPVVLATGTAVEGDNEVAVTAPAGVGDHDLRVGLVGPTGQGSDTEAGALRVRPLPTVALTAPTGAAPATVGADDDVEVAFTSDQGGPFVVEVRGAGSETWTTVDEGDAATGATTATVPGLEPGTYDLRVRVTGPTGEGTATADDAIVVLDVPAVAITSPVTGEPSVGAVGRTVTVTFTSDQAGTYSARFGDGASVTGAAVAGSNTLSLVAPAAPGTHDLVVEVTGIGGEGGDEEAAAVVTHETAPAEITAASRFVDAAHQTFLGRPATDPELTAGVGRLLGGTSRSVIVGELARSDEWIGRSVDDLYRTILGRPADPDGLAFWTARARAGMRLTDVGVGFYAAPEYYASVGGTPDGYVASLYETLLEREGSADEVAYWVGRLGSGATRSAVARGFYASIESRRDRVTRLYEDVLGRAPDTDGLAFWAQQLLTRDDVVLAASLAASAEYYANAQA